ncbi:hypothetical protein KEH51_27040, partial [[Brevibacterium] frigoritolerans]|nr:hypothetical protein [Peribacillus frigoritolerans]
HNCKSSHWECCLEGLIVASVSLFTFCKDFLQNGKRFRFKKKQRSGGLPVVQGAIQYTQSKIFLLHRLKGYGESSGITIWRKQTLTDLISSSDKSYVLCKRQLHQRHVPQQNKRVLFKP